MLGTYSIAGIYETVRYRNVIIHDPYIAGMTQEEWPFDLYVLHVANINTCI